MEPRNSPQGHHRRDSQHLEINELHRVWLAPARVAAQTTQRMSTFEINSDQVRARLRRLPVFPLPNAVLIPGGHMPLHVFEPRYRKMIADCLESDRLLAVGLLDEEDLGLGTPPAIRSTVGLGHIEAHGELPDGRYLILVQGLIRLRTLREVTGPEPYRLLHVVPVLDRSPSREAVVLHSQVLRRQVRTLVGRLPEEAGEVLSRTTAGEGDPGRLADVVASAVLADERQRQTYLELSDVEQRLERMTETLATVIAALSHDDAPAFN